MNIRNLSKDEHQAYMRLYRCRKIEGGSGFGGDLAQKLINRKIATRIKDVENLTHTGKVRKVVILKLTPEAMLINPNQLLFSFS